MIGIPPFRPPFPSLPPINSPMGGIPAYNSNNVGPGYNAHENEFQRLQQDALNSPNFALEYVTPGEKVDRDAYNYGGLRPDKIS